MKTADIIKKILGEYEIRTASLGGKYAVWNISHSKATNFLVRSGWKSCINPMYIQDESGQYVVRKNALNHKNYFIIEY